MVEASVHVLLLLTNYGVSKERASEFVILHNGSR